jgi:sugar (pentulose or hexulose) kinase
LGGGVSGVAQQNWKHMRILAIEVGGSSVKAAVLEVANSTLITAPVRVPFAVDHPVPEAAEVPADRLWNALTASARQASRGLDDIQGVGLACVTPALVLLDAGDRPLAPIRTDRDRRARPAARQVWAAVGQEFLATTGNRPLPGGISAVSWRQQVDENPYLIRQAQSYLHVNGWLALRMTGERALDPANASCSGLFGTLTDQQWSARWCEYFEVEPGWLPPVCCGSTTMGTLRPAAAAELGLPGGLPVKLGASDTDSAVLATGMGPGDLYHDVSSIQLLAAITDNPRPDAGRLTRRLGVGEGFIHITHNPVGGMALDWLRKLCFHDQSEQFFYVKTIPEALQRRTNVTLDPAFLGGDGLEIEAHRAAFRDLTLASDRLDLLTAVLEALARRQRAALQALGIGPPYQRIFLGGSHADIVRRAIPEYAGQNVIGVEDGSLRGVARLFSIGKVI